MDKYCEKCGALLAEDALFCFTCGARIPKTESVDNTVVETEKEIVVESVVEAETAPADAVISDAIVLEVVEEEPAVKVEEDTVQPAKIKKSVTGLISLILVFAIILGAFSFAGYKVVDRFLDKRAINDAVSDYVDIVYFGEYEKAEGMIPEFFFESEVSKDMIDEFIEASDAEALAEKRGNYMDITFGKDIVVTSTITDFRHMGKDSSVLFSDIFLANYTVYYDVSIDIQDLYKLTFEVQVEGSKEEKTYVYKVYAMQDNGDWYFYNAIDFGFLFSDAFDNITKFDEDIGNSASVYDDIVLY